MRTNLDSLLHPPIRYSIYGWAVVALLVACTTWALSGAYREHQQAQEIDARANSLRSRLAKVAKTPKRSDAEEQKHWQELQVERAFPWESIFRAIEKTARPEIATLEFMPDKRTGHLILRGEAQNLKALIDYVDALAEERGLARVYLAHQQPAGKDKVQTVGFEIHASIER